jgi:hypothetical protein
MGKCDIIIIIIIIIIIVIKVPAILNQGSRHEGVLERRGIAPCILNLGARLR